MIKSFLKLFGFSGRSGQRAKESNKEILDEQIAKSIEDFKNRPIYKNLTAEIVDETSDDELLQLVVENLIIKFPQDYTKKYETVLNWTKSQQAVYMVWYLEAEVGNGGFNQYYFNSSGQFSKQTPAALRLIGANNLAELMVRANDIYETENKEITLHQDGTIEGFSRSYTANPLNKLDGEFYDLSKRVSLDQLQVDFIRRNRQDFIGK